MAKFDPSKIMEIFKIGDDFIMDIYDKGWLIWAIIIALAGLLYVVFLVR